MNLRKLPRTLVLTAGYAALVNLSVGAALVLRHDGLPPADAMSQWARLAGPFTLLSLLGYLIAGLYHGLWRYAGTATALDLARGVSLSAIAWIVCDLLSGGTLAAAHGMGLRLWLVQFVLLGAVRLGWRLRKERGGARDGGAALPTLVIGAGHAGVSLLQDMRRQGGSEALAPVGFVDADFRLTGHRIEGVKVLGTLEQLAPVLRETGARLAVVSDPAISGRTLRALAAACEAEGVRLRVVPPVSELRPGAPITLARVRDVRLEDLLGREPVPAADDDVGAFLRGRRVLVTGAGGSIGSELARQVARFEPASLVLLDHAENGLYYIERELSAAFPGRAPEAVVADLCDAEGVEALFARTRPEVVLHAAAHKHVPLLEHAPREAVLNNVVSTRQLVDAAGRHGVSHFVLISTDKAVNPTSVMGASKRVCERLVQAASRRGAGVYCAVRFGNVLGSEGSVVPIFQRQLERGGPVTVTHPEATRYFMTIPEAVRLVLQAAALGRGGEVFLLDMGEPVKVVDVARQLIRLAGLREGEDVQIVFTGLRPGEKLHEELHSQAEQARMTRRERILTWDLAPEDDATLRAEVRELEAAAVRGSAAEIRAALARAVPEYRADTEARP